MSYHNRGPSDGERGQGRGGRRGGKVAPAPRQVGDGFGAGSSAGLDSGSQVEERPFAWGGGGSRDRAGHARKRGPSVPGPASVASSTGNHMQSLGTLASRNNAAGGLQSLGLTQSSRAAPKPSASAETSASAASSALASQAASAAAPAANDSAPAESATAGSLHVPAAVSSAEAAAITPGAPGQPAAESSPDTAVAEQAQSAAQKDGSEMGSRQAPAAQSEHSSLRAPPVQPAGSQQQHKRGGQQTGQPESSDRGPVPAHAQDGQVQGPRGGPQTHRWGRGPQGGRGSPGRPTYNHHQPGRHGSAYPHSPPQPLQYGSFAPGPVPPMYQAQDIPGMPQAFGQHPVSFGSITPSMAGAPAYFQPVPVAPFVPGPAHHTLHANAHEFVPLQGYAHASGGPQAPPRAYPAPGMGGPAMPNKHAPVPHTPYAQAPGPQAPWPHESPPRTPRLQASDDILRVSGEVPDDDLRETSQPGPSAQTRARPELASGNSAPAVKPADPASQQSSSAAEAAARAIGDAEQKADKQQMEDVKTPKSSVESASAGQTSMDRVDNVEAAPGQASSVNPDIQGAAAPNDPQAKSPAQAPSKAEPVQAGAPLSRPEQTSLDSRPPSKQAAAPRSKEAAVQQRPAAHGSRPAAAPVASALPASAGWAKRRIPAAPQPQPMPQAPAATAAAAQQPATAPAPALKADVPANDKSTPAASAPANQPAAAASSCASSGNAALSNSTAQQSPTKPASVPPSAPERAQPPPLPSSAAAPTAVDSGAGSRQPAEQPAHEGAPSGTTSSEHTPPQQAQDPLSAPKAAPKQPAEAPKKEVPAQRPEHAASAQAPKPKSWANMAAKLSEGGADAAFKAAPPKAPVSRPLSTASSGVSVQSSRGNSGRERAPRGQSRDPLGRPAGQDGQRRGRGGQDGGRNNRDERSMDSRGNRDGRRGPRDSPHDSSAASRNPEGAHTLSPRAVPARPPVGRSAVAVSPSAPKQEQQSQSQSTASQEGEAAQTSAKAEASGVASAEDSSQAKQADSTGASQKEVQESPEQASDQTMLQGQSRSEDSSVPAKQEVPAGESAATKPAQAAPSPPLKPLSGAQLEAVQRLCASVDEAAASSAASKPLMPRGLVNTGNLCFMNSILQALMGGKDFCGFLQHLQAASPALSARELPTLHALSSLAAEFQPVSTSAESPDTAMNGEKGKRDPEYKAKGEAPKSAWSKPNAQGASGLTLAARLNQQALLPDMMFPLVNRFNPNNGQPLPTSNGKTSATAAAAAAAAANRQQEDAQEFLSYLLDSTHQELLRLKARISSAPGAEAEESASQGADGEEWLTAGRSKKRKAVTRGTTSLQGGVTPASDVFGGALRSEVRAQGAPPSATLEPCFLVHLDIHPETVHSVSDALSAFTSPETISGYKVKDDSNAVTARKVVQLFQLPRILVLHLKRFSYTLNGTGKIHRTINYPERLRLLPSWIAELCPEPRHRGGAEYELIATVLHLGKTPSAGHYIADVRQRDGKWLRFDDADLSYVPANVVINDHRAYLLFYQLRA